ncbi:MAG: hypothetical protein KKH02_08545 [Proteobacteria bacterium]|nr:hypothetical protein [Pseudomonadota bacterium]
MDPKTIVIDKWLPLRRLFAWGAIPVILLTFLLLWPPSLRAEETYTFDLSEIEKKPYHFSGYVEMKPTIFQTRQDSSLYRLKYYNRDLGKSLEEANLKLQIEGSYEKGIARLYFKTNTDCKISLLGDQEKTDLYEGFISLNPSSAWKIDAGKKTFKWGKGYAWNPVAFIDRPKDPDDPEVGMEGVFAVSTDFTKSFDGPLKTISFTPVLQPVYDHINAELGKKDYLNLAGKLYLLFYDTDIDFIFLTGGSRTTRFGADFSRNIGTNWEIHGEAAYIKDFRANLIDPSGKVSATEYDATSFLLGTRYLTDLDTTFILEYYRNGTAFSGQEMKDFFGFINDAYRTYTATGSDTALQKAVALSDGNYGRANPMRDYLYLRIAQKEPFDILYFNPAITTIYNLNDRSFTVSPEMVYTRITNLDLRLKASFIAGPKESEYREKPFGFKLELRVGYYF